jgi:Fe-S cluster assembly iron-binding protein IscA
MIQVTENAATEIKNVLSANKSDEEHGLKLVPVEQGGVGITIDKPQPGDAVLKDGERPLLIVDSTIARNLDGVVLDVSDEDKKRSGGARFVLRGQPGA